MEVQPPTNQTDSPRKNLPLKSNKENFFLELATATYIYNSIENDAQVFQLCYSYYRKIDVLYCDKKVKSYYEKVETKKIHRFKYDLILIS